MPRLRTMFILALGLGTVAMLVAFQVIGGYRPDEASEAALVAVIPFLGVALSAVVKSQKYRKQVDVNVLGRDVKDLAWLLVLSGFYVVFLLFVWGL